VLALFGPTAAGKSALAHAAALALGGEVVVADPFQRYRGLEIAADSPRPHERAEVPHHLVGDLDLAEASTAADFAARAHAAVDDVLARGRVPVVAGGTGLYLRAALGVLGFPPPPPPAVREWAAALSGDPPAALAALRGLDPAAAERVDARNPRRLARALEVARTGAGAPRERLWSPDWRRPTLLVGVTRPRPVLHALIIRRVRRELEEGLVAELRAALGRPDLAREPAQVIGMREVAAMDRGEMAPGDLEEALVVRTRRLARMQETWLRKLPVAAVIDLGEAPAADALPRVLRLLGDEPYYPPRP
jgi:tRNA dimethylallyltransferase